MSPDEPTLQTTPDPDRQRAAAAEPAPGHTLPIGTVIGGLLMRLVGLLMPGAFRKQSQQHMQDFKAFAEQGVDVREAKD